MLRKIRITLATLFFAGITLLFLDFTGAFHLWLGWLAKIQFLPALLALNAAVVILLAVATLIFGRVYCSVICPLGIMQDIISKLHCYKKKYRYRFGYTKEKKWLRYGFLGVFIILLVAGFSSIAAIIEPYSSFGRIASNIFAPIYRWGNNILAYFAERLGSYSFYSTDVWIKGLPTFIIAAATFVIIFIMAWRGGRTYCNTVCPVGTILGLLSRHSIFRPTIDTSKCVNCGLCGKGCKASCIDTANHKIDYSRCVMCMDCIDNCSSGAISYRLRTKNSTTESAETSGSNSKKEVSPDKGRRAFIGTASFLTASVTIKAQEKKVDGGLAVIQDKKIPVRQKHIVPPGAASARHFAQHCTACQLCVSSCPNGVLRPSTDLQRFMQPEMGYEKGYCRPECNECSHVCPTSAIRPISIEDKSSIRIGHATVIPENCIGCGHCARKCPSGAIEMVKTSEGKRIPTVNETKCIGCGACENLCPVRPFSAIYVEGTEVHQTI